MITTTAQALIASTMRLIGVWAAGESGTAAESQDALNALNGLIDNWSLQRSTIYAVARQVFDLTDGQQSYTVGEGGDFEIDPPIWIQNAGIVYPDSVSDPRIEQALTLLTDNDYAALTLKGYEADYPFFLYYERTTAELATIYLFPGPASTDLQLALYLPTAIPQFSNLTEEVVLANGYHDALRYNLAIRLAPEYTRPLDPLVDRLARETLADLKRGNFREMDLAMDPAVMGRNRQWYSILSDCP